MCKELQHVEFFQLRPSTRVKKIANGLQKVIERRKKEIETFDEKQARIKAIAERINQKLSKYQ